MVGGRGHSLGVVRMVGYMHAGAKEGSRGRTFARTGRLSFKALSRSL